MKQFLFVLAIVVLTLQSVSAASSSSSVSVKAHRNDSGTMFREPILARVTINTAGQATPDGTYTASYYNAAGGNESNQSFSVSGGVVTPSYRDFLLNTYGAGNSVATSATSIVDFRLTKSGGHSIDGTPHYLTINVTRVNTQSEVPTANKQIGIHFGASLTVSQITWNLTTENWSNHVHYTAQGFETRSISYRIVEAVGSSVFLGLSPSVGATSLPVTITRSDKVSDWEGKSWKVVSDIAGDTQVYLSGTVPSGSTQPITVTANFDGPFPKPSSVNASPTPIPLPTTSPTPMVTVTPYSEPSATPFPTPVTTPFPTATPPTITASPAEVMRNDNGTASGQVHLTNAKDIYGPIVDAIKRIDGGGGVPGQNPGDGSGVTGEMDLGTNPVTQSADNSKHKLGDNLIKGQVAYDNTISSGKTKLASIQPLTVPVVSGSKTSWAITLPKLGAFTVDISPYQTVITIMRSLLLMMLIMGTWFSTVKIIRSGIA
jgi:hypothetical protein